ncbi:site-2 protease family protein [Heyndrickxia sp. NPDC080065]|uniref:site-2 protease family protein n=1 Tax=Heyndrickxia sp. NPDC080065 TaxID=3390568 RepID=UPI003D020214
MTILLFLFIIAPITIVIHELGHALGAWMMRADDIEINIGSGPKLFSLQSKKWTIHFYLLYILGAHTSSQRVPYFSNTEKIVIAILGPLVNGVIGFIIEQWGPVDASNIWQLFALFNFWLFIMNLIPYRISGKQSDGYTILQTLLNKKVD